MPTNDFIGFASAGSANIMSQADYAAAAEQADGVQPGPASSALANKIWRQGANMASALGAFILAQGYDALDDGDLGTLTSNLTRALSPVYGTWTPELRGSTTNGAFTYTTQNGEYYKFGPFVYVYGQVVPSACTSLPAGTIQITGLPYTVYGFGGARIMTIGARANGFDSNSAQKLIGFFAGGGSTVMIGRAIATDSNIGISAFPEADWSSSSSTAEHIKVTIKSYTATGLNFAGWYLTTV